jgi:hypothetical protein
MRDGSSHVGLGHEFYQKGRPNLSIGGLHLVHISLRNILLTSHDDEREDNDFEDR